MINSNSIAIIDIVIPAIRNNKAGAKCWKSMALFKFLTRLQSISGIFHLALRWFIIPDSRDLIIMYSIYSLSWPIFSIMKPHCNIMVSICCIWQYSASFSLSVDKINQYIINFYNFLNFWLIGTNPYCKMV